MWFRCSFMPVPSSASRSCRSRLKTTSAFRIRADWVWCNPDPICDMNTDRSKQTPRAWDQCEPQIDADSRRFRQGERFARPEEHLDNFRQVLDSICRFPVLGLRPEVDEEPRLLSVRHQGNHSPEENNPGVPQSLAS